MLLVFIIVRFSVFVIYFIKYCFDDRLIMARIHRIMGVDFQLHQMVKNLYQMNPLFFGSFLSFILTCLFSILAFEYEIYNPLIMSLGDSIWYVFITVMTVGYGDIYAISYLGQITMIIATFSGIVFSSIFVVCVDEFLKMSENEKKAFMMLNRIKYKQEVIKNSIGFFTSQYKIKSIFRERYQLRNRKHRAHDLFLYEKSKADYLYMFYMSQNQYDQLLDKDFKRETFGYQMFSQQEELQKVKNYRNQLSNDIRHLNYKLNFIKGGLGQINSFVDYVNQID